MQIQLIKLKGEQRHINSTMIDNDKEGDEKKIIKAYMDVFEFKED